MPSNRPSARGSRSPGAATRPSRSGAGARPGSRPGARSGPGRSRATSAPHAARTRLTGRAVILVLVLALLAASYASSMRAYLEQKQHLEELRASIAKSQQNIAVLEREKRRWQDPAFIEAQATQHLSWVMPGDISFQVIGKDGKPLDHQDNLSDPGRIRVENEPAWWQTAWRTVEAAGNPQDVPNPVKQIDPPTKGKR